MKARSRLSLFASALLAAASTAACTRPAALPTAAPATAAAPSASGVDLAGIDRSVSPGDDFFAYANGSWLKTTEIPADRSSYGAGAIMSELTEKRVAGLIAEAALSKSPAGSEARKIGDTYTTFMDEAAIEAKGLAPLKPALERIAAISDATGLATALGETLRADVDVLNATKFYTRTSSASGSRRT